jgi:signal transduction histidine kinase
VPKPHEAGAIAARVSLDPAALYRAARTALQPDGRTVLAAVRTLRHRELLLRWLVEQRNRAADRRRNATAALAQMVVTSEEFHALYRDAQRQRSELVRREREVERLARDAVRARDEERARVAHQIHDTAAQSMVSAYRFLEATRASLPAPLPGQADDHLASASALLQAAIIEVRAVLGGLLPAGLEQRGIGAAVRDRLAQLTAGTGATGSVTGSLPRLVGWVEQAIYSMTMEAVSNAVRHAHAATIHVQLEQRGGRIVVIVSDDGVGFNLAARSRGGSEGLGLPGMSHQAGWLGGRATIRSHPGNGTVVRISVPLKGHRTGGTDIREAGPASPGRSASAKRESALAVRNGTGDL